MDKKRSIIQPMHRQESTALKALWDDRHRRTQAEFGLHFDLGNQSNVGNYLLARSALNMKAALAFAAELNCDVADFSPRLAGEIRRLGVAAPGPAISEWNPREERLLKLFRSLPAKQQDLVVAMVGGASRLTKSIEHDPVSVEMKAARAKVVEALSWGLASSYFGSSNGEAELAMAAKRGLGGFEEMAAEQLIQCAQDSGLGELLAAEIALLDNREDSTREDAEMERFASHQA